jgi:nitrite reductase/ring-hydroxylating ferredoxin subunit
MLGAPLSAGILADIEDIEEISCILHGWSFNLETGSYLH